MRSILSTSIAILLASVPVAVAGAAAVDHVLASGVGLDGNCSVFCQAYSVVFAKLLGMIGDHVGLGMPGILLVFLGMFSLGLICLAALGRAWSGADQGVNRYSTVTRSAWSSNSRLVGTEYLANDFMPMRGR